MKSSDLESKAKQSAPPYCHPPESPVVSLSDLLSKWPQDRERFQVILDLNTETYVTIFTFCKWLVLRTISEIVSSCKINTLPISYFFLSLILQLSSLAHHRESSVPYRLRLELLDAISATTSSWKPLCIHHPQT